MGVTDDLTPAEPYFDAMHCLGMRLLSNLTINILSRDYSGGQWLRILLPMLGTPGLILVWERISHAARQLSLCARTTEPALQGLCSTLREATAREAHLPQLQKSLQAAMRD